MGFGINKLIKVISLRYIYRLWKRKKIYRQNEGKNLKIDLGCSIANVNFGNKVYLGSNVTLLNSTISDHSYINSNSSIRNTKIGKYCSIASNVKIVLGSHPTNLVSTHPAFYSNNKEFETYAGKMYFNESSKVEIGNDVWVGEDVMIPGGITIGDGAIIAARALVTKNVEPYSVVGGVPAKHIKYRFNQREIETLLSYKWWDRDEEWLRENYLIFLDPKDFFNCTEFK